VIDYADLNHPRNERLHTPPTPTKGDDRSPAQHDRDRVIYTSAFRRLAEITQVVSPESGHVFHNRLTHSLQVAQVGRRLAEKLRLRHGDLADEIGGIDPDAVEAACFAHDLGHPPFGHIAEEKLNELADKYGGFEGNAQSFRIVTKLAFRSLEHRGLDLTRATLGAILKYPWLKGRNSKKPKKWGAYASEDRDFKHARGLSQSLSLEHLPNSEWDFGKRPEAELMEWADDVTYSVHDIEDFYRAGRIPMHLLAKLTDYKERVRFFDDVYARHANETDFFPRPDLEEAFADVLAMHWRLDEPYSGTQDQRARLRDFTGKLIGRYINGVELSKQGNKVLLAIDPEKVKEVSILKELTWTYVIEAPTLATRQEGQKEVIGRLFSVYANAASSEKAWKLFPPYYREQLKYGKSDSDRVRTVVDLIAGMTERVAVAKYTQLIGISPDNTLNEMVW
jgi:dGTPase